MAPLCDLPISFGHLNAQPHTLIHARRMQANDAERSRCVCVSVCVCVCVCGIIAMSLPATLTQNRAGGLLILQTEPNRTRAEQRECTTLIRPGTSALWATGSL